MKDSYKAAACVLSAYCFGHQSLLAAKQARWSKSADLLYFAQFWGFIFRAVVVVSIAGAVWYGFRAMRSYKCAIR